MQILNQKREGGGAQKGGGWQRTLRLLIFCCCYICEFLSRIGSRMLGVRGSVVVVVVVEGGGVCITAHQEREYRYFHFLHK